MRTKANICREMRPLVEAAEDQGWEVTQTRGNHIRFQSPTGAVCFSAQSPSDYRSTRNLRSRLRREGLVLP